MRKYIAHILAEPDGSPSFARHASLLMIAAAIGWVTYQLVKSGTMPDLAAVTAFCMSLYGPNKIITKVADAAASMVGKKSSSPAAPPQEQ